MTLQPQFGGGDNPTITGYQANNSIKVKIRTARRGVADLWP